MAENKKIEKILGYITDRIIGSVSEQQPCSAEWLYQKGRRDAFYEMLKTVQGIYSNEQQK